MYLLFSMFISANLYNLHLINLKLDNTPKDVLESKDLKKYNEGVYYPPSPELSGDYKMHNFTYTLYGRDYWNKTWSYENLYNATWFSQPETAGYEVTWEFNITDLKDNTTKALINVGAITNLYLFYNDGVTLQALNPIQPDGLGRGTLTGYTKLPSSLDGQFIVIGWTYSNKFVFNATMRFWANKSGVLGASFVPDKENTQSNYINWELNFEGYIPGNYRGELNINENTTLISIQGKNDLYWHPITSYTRNKTHLIIHESFEQYRVIIQELNYVQVIYNENLTIVHNELKLFVTCLMPGNLSIRYKLPNGTIIEQNYTVLENEVISFNYILQIYDIGGLAELNVTLINETLSNQFGVKIINIMHFKNAFVYAFPEEGIEVEAFSEFYIAATYVDYDYFYWLAIQNSTIGSPYYQKLTIFEIINMSTIKNASVRYETDALQGDLEFGPFFENLSMYQQHVDLKEIQILPGDYNLTYIAKKKGYTSVTDVRSLNITKRKVYFSLTSMIDVLTIEGDFSFGVNLYVINPYEAFLRLPVNLSMSVVNNDTMIEEDQFTIPGIVQSLSIIDVVSNDTLPGNYYLNFTVISEYYEGNLTHFFKILPKELSLTLEYGFNEEVLIGAELKVNWSQNGNHNFENMTLNVDLDGIFHQVTNMTKYQKGNISILLNDTLPGSYTLNFTIISPFYNGTQLFQFEIIKKSIAFSLNFERKIEEGEAINFGWNLEGLDYYENMTLEIYVDGSLKSTVNITEVKSGTFTLEENEGLYEVKFKLISPFYSYEESFEVEFKAKTKKEEVEPAPDNTWYLIIALIAIIAMGIFAVVMFKSRGKIQAQRELDSELVALKNKTQALQEELYHKANKIAQIASIYWLIIVHNEMGVNIVEITDFRFGEVLHGEEEQLIGKGAIRDGALISGFLTAIRNFGKETSSTGVQQPIFNSQTDYSTIINDQEIHRRILEGNHYFMAVISAKETSDISDVLTTINGLFSKGYTDKVIGFKGNVDIFRPFTEEVIAYLHEEINNIRANIETENQILQKLQKELNEVQNKIGIKDKKKAPISYK